MGNISSKKTEQRAITKINELIDKIESADGHIQNNDKSISWDGTIDFYHGNIDKKKNFQFSIDVQVKGRTTNNKKLTDKSYFDLSVIDMQNFLKKDGTLLFMCLFKRESDDFKIYFSSLLPYHINNYLKNNNSSDTIRVKMKEIKNASHLESICRNFQIDKEMQKKMNQNMFNQENLTVENGKVARFSLWDKDMQNFNPQKLVGMSKFIYTFDEHEYPIGASFGIIYNIIENLNAVISDTEKEIIYKDIKLETKLNEQLIYFGNSFNFNLTKHTFNIRIRGSLLERVKDLHFINKAFINKGFLINEKEFAVEFPEKEFTKFKTLLSQYEELKQILLKHNVNKDLNFDEWQDKDFDKLNIWLTAIEDKVPLNLKSEISLIGSITIKDLRLSIMAHKNEEGSFNIENLWNNIDYKKYVFKYHTNEKVIKTNNLYLTLNSEAYLSDDINFDEMRTIFTDYSLSDDEYELLNAQVLEIIKAYDYNKNSNLLSYAKFLVNNLLEKDSDSHDIYYINLCQILKRENKLTDEEIKELMNIKTNNSDVEIQLCCSLLMDSKVEASILIKNIDYQTMESFKTYPISIYL